MPSLNFIIEKKLKNRLGRAGSIETSHGFVETPAFVVVGTKAAVKAVSPEQLSAMGAQIVLANTYHLYLQPGEEVVRQAGGLHEFMGWDKPTMTDSGGFQAYSLGSAYARDYKKFISKGELETFIKKEKLPEKTRDMLASINEDGVVFKSHLDGSSHTLTPEKSIEIQHGIGADIIFAFDECTSPTDPYDYQKLSMERTHRWAERSLTAHKKRGPEKAYQSLFGIVQGGPYEDLRKLSAKTIASMDFDGFGIGGSYTKEDMEDVLRWVNPLLPEDKPRHLLGIGEPLQLFMGIEDGVDTFDCVAPTREGRNGSLYTKRGRINILNAKFRQDFNVIDVECGCYTCQKYSRAYLAHLFRAGEIFGLTLASIHNLHFIVNLVKEIRVSILDGRFAEFKEDFLKTYYG
jgi:queuine tRNA-ribosyltransferase